MYSDLPIRFTLGAPVSGPATWGWPVVHLDTWPSRRRPVVPSATSPTARGRWPRNGSAATFSSLSTPRNMITNRKSTTMAPA